jgi:hypothetical protein
MVDKAIEGSQASLRQLARAMLRLSLGRTRYMRPRKLLKLSAKVSAKV